ncbi:lanthionine synthetase C family protein [Streptomyces roseifaciens]
MSAAVPGRLRAEVADTVEGMARYLLGTADRERSDRLWPAHFMVFATNPLNVAYGACGPALFLHTAERAGGLPDDVRAWMRNRPLDLESYPPGLFPGLAGIAETFWRIGLAEEALDAMALLYRSPLLEAEPGLFLGAAGWGTVSLRFHARTGDQVHLDAAVRAGEHLLATAEGRDGTCCWPYRAEGRVHYGLGYGASGIALFLLRLALATGRGDFRSAAIRGLEFDLENRSDTEVGAQWRRFEDDMVRYPYLIHGSAGIGCVLLRFHRMLGDERYLALARRLADDAYLTYALLPSLFEGMAGLGEFQLDMFRCTAGPRYLHRAFDIAETMLMFRVERPEGVAFPGRVLNRISADYATGAAGVGLYFTRLLSPGGMAFLDDDPPGAANGRASRHNALGADAIRFTDPDPDPDPDSAPA